MKCEYLYCLLDVLSKIGIWTVGMIFTIIMISIQDHCLFGFLNISETFYYYGRIYSLDKSEIKTRMENLLNFLDLENIKSCIINLRYQGISKALNICCHTIAPTFIKIPTFTVVCNKCLIHGEGILLFPNLVSDLLNFLII